MTDRTHPTWRWEEFDPHRTSMSGDISKLFRNEPIKAPGILAVEAPPSNASVMMREVIQNSWDAARELQGNRTAGTSDRPSPPGFEVRFEFKETSGPGKPHVVAALGLPQLAEQRSRFEEAALARGRDRSEARRTLGLPPESCLDVLTDESEPVRVLVITESGTTGMYGPWGVDSRMYLAMCSVGYTPKVEGGGSFGYGKAGMIRGSATRTVFAYSCFEERDDDPGVTRRLIGMTYWGEHRVGDSHYTGFGRFGASEQGRVSPLENHHADAAARALGLPVRNAENPAEIGTTFLIVDPVVAPDDLRRAAERHWWPALEDPSVDFSVRIESAGGDVLIPRPKLDAVLESFRQAYDLAIHPPEQAQDGTFVTRFQAPAKGYLALTSDLDGWSYPESRAELPQHRDRTLVALVRDPRMVVEYLSVGRESMRPLLRGVFVADPSIDAALRRTEPKGHDCWQTSSEDVDEDDLRVAKKVVARIKRRVSTFRGTLKPPPRPVEEVSLPEFDRVMRRLLTGPGPIPPPPKGDRAFRIVPTPRPEAVGTDSIRVAGQAQFGLRDDFKGGECEVEIRLRYAFDEDGSMGSDVNLQVTAPDGFRRGDREGAFFGTLVKGHDVTFDYVSDPHSGLWTGRLVATAEQVKATTA